MARVNLDVGMAAMQRNASTELVCALGSLRIAREHMTRALLLVDQQVDQRVDQRVDGVNEAVYSITRQLDALASLVSASR